MSEIWNLNTLCRCCHADGNFISLDSTCNIMGSTENFSNILINTFGIHLKSPPIDVSNSICNGCIKHLLDSTLFKRRVEECEQKFQNYCKNELLQNMAVKVEKVEDDNNFEYEMLIEPPNIDTKVEMQEIKEETSIDEDNCDQPESDNEKIEIELQEKLETKVNENVKSDLKEKSDSKPNKPCTSKENVEKLKSKKSFTNIKQSENQPKYTCTICNISMKSQNRYEKHMFNHSICRNSTTPLDQMTTFDCKMCPRSYKKLLFLIQHQNTHTRKNVYICDVCNKEFLYKNVLRNHILWHMGLNKQFMCDACGHSFNDITNLKTHVMTVHEKLKLFKCTLCPKEFAAKKTLKAHIHSHSGTKPFQCNICTKAFVWNHTLVAHMRKHENKRKFGGIYICKICREPFDHRGIYVSHIRSHQERKHHCDVCEETFTTNYSLKRHMDKHSGVKRFPCSNCDKIFVTRSKLAAHKRYHDPNRIKKLKMEKVPCVLCKKAVSDMEKHMKVHYNKRHKCHLCDRAYAERNTLHRHIKECHEGVRHECDMCGKSFIKASRLKTHKMKDHNIQCL